MNMSQSISKKLFHQEIEAQLLEMHIDIVIGKVGVLILLFKYGLVKSMSSSILPYIYDR